MSEVETSLVRSSDEAFKIVDSMAGKDFLDEMFFVDLDDVPPEELKFLSQRLVVWMGSQRTPLGR